ncbi:MAG TPA: hypothetical protein VLZ83_08155 [Edaphocola sp.]|nr:hypothetical protein [Edaphocola sp.]
MNHFSFSQSKEEVQDTITETEDSTTEAYESDNSPQEQNDQNGFHYNKEINSKKWSPKKIDQNKWEKISKHPDYTYQKEVIKPIREHKPDIFSRFLIWFLKLLSGAAGSFLMWALLLILVIYTLYQFFKRNGYSIFQNKHKKFDTAFDSEEDKYLPEQWEQLIKQSEKDGNFRLATRQSFRHIISILKQKSDWDSKDSATNYDYLKSIKDKTKKDEFKKLLRHYEYVWYGAFPIEALQYQKITSVYQSLKSKLIHH